MTQGKKSPHGLPEQVRAWARSEITASGCWEWKGSVAGPGGYAVIRQTRGRRMLRLNRLSAQWFLGMEPGDTRHVLHKCDNPRCWNPAHLYLGTHQDNMSDKAARRRGRSGKQKLTSEQVQEIRAAIARGERNMDIARRYPVSRSMISSIRHGRYWK